MSYEFSIDYNVPEQRWTIYHGPSKLPVASGGGWAMQFGMQLFKDLEAGKIDFEGMNKQEWPDNYPK